MESFTPMHLVFLGSEVIGVANLFTGTKAKPTALANLFPRRQLQWPAYPPCLASRCQQQGQVAVLLGMTSEAKNMSLGLQSLRTQ